MELLTFKAEHHHLKCLAEWQWIFFMFTVKSVLTGAELNFLLAEGKGRDVLLESYGFER